MPPSLKTYQNRCRCCLETFADDEKPSPITDFFELQYFAFTKVELKKNELLSRYVCEFCHMELLRFSVWKKELIEKQQTLYKLLKQQTNKESLELSDGEIHNEGSDSDESEEYSTHDDISSDEINDIQQNGDEDEMSINSDDDDPDDTQLSSEHEPDSDFEISIHHKRRPKRSTSLEQDKSSKKKDLRCRVCNTTFLARQGLVRHETFCRPNKLAGRKPPEKMRKKVFTDDAKYRCFCNERFTSFRALNIHRTRKHGKHTNMSWDIIDKEQNDVNGKSSASSTKIGNSSKNIENIRIKSSPSKKVEGSFKCNHCAYKTDSQKTLRYHMRANHSELHREASTKLECEECFKLFSTSTALRMHVLTVHHDIRQHACLYCTSTFKQLVHLKEHMLAIHKTLHKPYCCACGSSFSTITALKQHKNEDHKEEEEQELNRNFKDLLPPVKLSGKYICVCSREFTYPSRLLEHQRYCKYYKTQSESAVTPKRSEECVVGGNKLFKCFKCGRGFNQRSNLIRHQKSSGHLDLELKTKLKFSCENCKQKFFRLSALQKHQKGNSCNING